MTFIIILPHYSALSHRQDKECTLRRVAEQYGGYNGKYSTATYIMELREKSIKL